MLPPIHMQLATNDSWLWVCPPMKFCVPSRTHFDHLSFNRSKCYFPCYFRECFNDGLRGWYGSAVALNIPKVNNRIIGLQWAASLPRTIPINSLYLYMVATRVLFYLREALLPHVAYFFARASHLISISYIDDFLADMTWDEMTGSCVSGDAFCSKYSKSK